MWIHLLRRILIALPTLWLVTLLGFCAMRFQVAIGPLDLPAPWTRAGTVHVLDKIAFKQPIDPLSQLKSNPQISAGAIEKETRRLGLDRPWYQQYWRWLTHALRGDWGLSLSGERVAWLLGTKLKNTLLLNLLTLIVTWALALPLGVWAAVRRGSWLDRGLTLLSSMGMALPGFVIALLLGVWAIQTGWLPFGGLTSAHFSGLSLWGKAWDLAGHLVLPVVVLTIGGMASLQRQMRSNLLEVLGAEFVRTARAKGLPERVVLWKHAVRNAINPLMTLLGYEFAALLSGAILVETVLGYPGLGYLTYQAALSGDANLVMATLVLSATLLIVGNLLADVLLRWVDPRIESTH
jgi:peptide/nickel transport system permease protein